MPIVPLYGHHALRARLLQALERKTLPQSLLFHGLAGVGKQRLALWLAQAMLCEPVGAPGAHEGKSEEHDRGPTDTSRSGGSERPCGRCQHCRYAQELAHPDTLWVFPRPRLDDAQDPDEARSDLIEAIRERQKASGLYSPPSGMEGIFVATVRMLVHWAATKPAVAKRKVIIVGDAERMVPQEGADQAANAFLKLLEEPAPHTWIILTTSALGALLPTIRSRVASVRIPLVSDAETRAFIQDAEVSRALDERNVSAAIDTRLELAAGAPGRLLSAAEHDTAVQQAKRLLEAASAGRPEVLYKAALAQKGTGARGAFSDVLDALTLQLHDRARAAASRQDTATAAAATTAALRIEDFKLMAAGNVNPQLLTARLLHELGRTLSASDTKRD